MKALTICQPYAELIANGSKPIENRTWYTPYRGPLLIHAGKSKAWLDDPKDDFVFGAVVASSELVACLRLDDKWPARFRDLQTHEHANGPYCWILDNVQRIDPVPYRGAQGLFEIPDSALNGGQ